MSPCTGATCGQWGTQTQTYKVIQSASGGGSACPYQNGHSATHRCQMPQCKGCVYSAWVDQGSCKANAGKCGTGSGSQLMARTILSGQNCDANGALMRTVPCDVDCWSAFPGDMSELDQKIVYLRCPVFGVYPGTNVPNYDYLNASMVYITVPNGTTDIMFTSSPELATRFTVHACTGVANATKNTFFLTVADLPDVVVMCAGYLSITGANQAVCGVKYSPKDAGKAFTCNFEYHGWGLMATFEHPFKDKDGKPCSMISNVSNNKHGFWSGFNNETTIQLTSATNYSAGVQYSFQKPV